MGGVKGHAALEEESYPLVQSSLDLASHPYYSSWCACAGKFHIFPAHVHEEKYGWLARLSYPMVHFQFTVCRSVVFYTSELPGMVVMLSSSY